MHCKGEKVDSDRGVQIIRDNLNKIEREINGIRKSINVQAKCLKRATRRAKREFYNIIMKKTDFSQIWDMVEWTKPRKLEANIMLKTMKTM